MAASQDKIRAKVNAVREAIAALNVKNEQICLVLQYYENDVDRTIAAFLEDGATEALQQWQTKGGVSKAAVTKKKKKKNKNKNNNSVENGIDLTDKRSACSETGLDPISEAIDTSCVSGTSWSNLSRSDSSGYDNLTPVTADDNHDSRNLTPQASSVESSSVAAKSNGQQAEPSVAPANRPSSQSNNHYQQQAKKGRDQGKAVRSDAHVSGSTVEPTPSAAFKKPPMTLEKSFKDLHRQTVALERLKIVLGENVDKSFKRVSEVFKELHKELSEREALIVSELTRAKSQTNHVLEEQETKARSLHQQMDRSSAMNENEMQQLRTNIKQYVGDRKLYEDMCASPLFSCSISHIVEDIRSFGQVDARVPSAGQQSSSAASAADDGVSHVPKAAASATSVSNANEKRSPVRSAPASSLHVLTQSDSLTRYEENERKQRLANSNGDSSQVNRSAPATDRGGRGRGNSQRGRGSYSGRGRDNWQSGGHGNSHESAGRSYGNSRTFYNSHNNTSGPSRGRGSSSDTPDHATSPTDSRSEHVPEKANGATVITEATCNGDVNHTAVNRKSSTTGYGNQVHHAKVNGHHDADVEDIKKDATPRTPRADGSEALPQRKNRRNSGKQRNMTSSNNNNIELTAAEGQACSS